MNYTVKEGGGSLLSLTWCIAAESGVGEVHNFRTNEQICPYSYPERDWGLPPLQLVPHCFKLSPALVQAFKCSERDTGEGGRL